jgi:hypothetical protein
MVEQTHSVPLYAHPAPAREPVGWLYEGAVGVTAGDFFFSKTRAGQPHEGWDETPLYAGPEPAREQDERKEGA